jgi:ribonucleoside-diphosphate reductase alpha chain
MIHVIKRDGTKEPINIEKIHKVVGWACDGLSGVSVSELELASQLQFYDKITTNEIHETMIKAASELITEDTPNYQYVAGRLINYQLRKEVYGQYEPHEFYFHYLNVQGQGYYDKELCTAYTAQEFEELGKYIDHERDNYLTYAAMEQFRGKYLVKNRVTNKYYETPQMAMMLIAMTLFQNYEKGRLKWVKELYDAISQFDISLPTPIMAGVRTPDRQFSSCVLIETDDNLDSIFTTAHAIGRYVSQKAGIGIGAGRLRPLGSPVNGGSVSHTGVIPFYRLFQSAVKSCSQGGVRGGAATLHYPFWHYEIEDLLVLKNNKGTEDNRLRHLDYSVQFNKVMYERLLTGGNITLFSPNDCPDLYEAFFRDVDVFRTLYEKYERKTSIRKISIPAVDLFSSFMQERKDTGRIYFQNVDHCNDHGSFDKNKALIKMSNLCQEITLPTTPLKDINDENGEISLCTLAAINWGKIKKPSDFEKPCTLVVRALDALLDYQSYPVLAAHLGTMGRRPLGVGIINFAYWLAKNNSTYTDPNLNLVHEYTEAWSYYLIKASIDLAEEVAPCPKHSDTLYSNGIMPIHTYKREVDELVEPVYRMDWATLVSRSKEYGIRNSTLMALMPAETSAQISNSTNGIEPPRALVSIKQSKDGVLKQVVPEINRLKNKYELLWDQKSPEGYIKIAAVLQKFIDQSISTNTSYNPAFYENGKIPMSEMLGHLLMMYRLGIKTGYYFNTLDHAGEIDINTLSPGDLDDESCDSCII